MFRKKIITISLLTSFLPLTLVLSCSKDEDAPKVKLNEGAKIGEKNVEGSGTNYKVSVDYGTTVTDQDIINIFTATDNDGQSPKASVFWDKTYDQNVASTYVATVTFADQIGNKTLVSVTIIVNPLNNNIEVDFEKSINSSFAFSLGKENEYGLILNKENTSLISIQNIQDLFSTKNEAEINFDWENGFDITKTGIYNLNLKVEDEQAKMFIQVIDKVDDDGLFLLKDFYDGQFFENSSPKESPSNKLNIPIGLNNSYSFTQSVMLGDKDYIFMIYDDDQNDGLKIDNFTETLYLYDSSIGVSDASIAKEDSLETVNKEIFKNTITPGSFGNNTYTAFSYDQNSSTTGTLNEYIGGQNANFPISKSANLWSKDKVNEQNDLFQQRLYQIYQAYQDKPEVYQALLKYYGLQITPNEDYTFSKDDSITGAPPFGLPTYQREPIFNFHKISNNIIAIQYNFTNTWLGSAVKMIIKDQKGDYNQYGSFSIGDPNEWKSYWKNDNVKYIGYKPEN